MGQLSAAQIEALGFAHVGRNVRPSDRALFYGAERISIGDNTRIEAALGLLQLRHVDAANGRRQEIDAQCHERLAGVPGISCLAPRAEMQGNYTYFPNLVGEDYPLGRDALYQRLRDQDIYARRYFHRLISNMPMYRGLPSAAGGNLPNARRVVEQVLRLPIFPAMADETVDRVCQLITDSVIQA